MRIDLFKENTLLYGQKGLPEDYPVPPSEKDMLFYIQRNHNKNTVVYEVNRLADGSICEDYPMNIFWIRYSDNGELQHLNYIQNKLAYGYKSHRIHEDLFQFEFVSYKEIKFYLVRTEENDFKVAARIQGRIVYLSNIYIYAEDFGLFPDVKYIEMYGNDQKSGLGTYEKLEI